MSFKLWLEAIEDLPYAFKAVFITGGPGSGKTTIAKTLFPNFTLADSDKVQELLAKVQDIPLSAEPEEPDYHRFQQAIHRTQALSVKRSEHWINQGYPIALVITGRNANLVVGLNNKLIQQGYDTGMIFVYTSLETAKRRNAQRIRRADKEFMEKAWHDANNNVNYYRELFGNNFAIIDNESGLDAPRQAERAKKQVVGNPYRISNPIGRRKVAESLPMGLPSVRRRWAMV